MAIRKFLSLEDGNLGSSQFTTRKNRDYIDLDLTFAVKPGPSGVDLSGDIYKKTGAEAVKQALKSLILCNEFEKPFQPVFGVGLQQMLFEFNDEISHERIKLLIEQKIKMYEPRVRVQLINIIPDQDNYSVRVELIAQVINTQETINFTTTLNRLR
jgi:phage baseplate assembly protein W